jgi:hypothetical protein
LFGEKITSYLIFSSSPSMSETPKNKEDSGTGTFKTKAPSEFLNYFGRDRRLHLWLQDKRTLWRLHLPRIITSTDTIRTRDLVFAGVVLYSCEDVLASFSWPAMIFDGLDGAFARHTGKPHSPGVH